MSLFIQITLRGTAVTLDMKYFLRRISAARQVEWQATDTLMTCYCCTHKKKHRLRGATAVRAAGKARGVQRCFSFHFFKRVVSSAVHCFHYTAFAPEHLWARRGGALSLLSTIRNVLWYGGWSMAGCGEYTVTPLQSSQPQKKER